MGEQAKRYMQIHKYTYQYWPFGFITDYWIDKDGVFNIRYEEGTWFRYKETDTGLIWW
ncbi:MAG TPA: hypothetical protein GXZ90_03130 [Clostridiales bacterium]|nr:hypothetical protein [Clostridiales bacterium]